MKTETEARNQQAINDFFGAFGTDTAKEYSECIFDLLLMVTNKKDLSQVGKEDMTTKLRDLNRLVLQLGAVQQEGGPIFGSVSLKN